MSILKPLDTGTGYLKATLQGFPKSGKSYTAVVLALGTRELMGMDGPIAYFDTEGASGYLNAMVKARTGHDLIGVRSRSLDDARTFLREAEEAGCSAAIIDSVTHLWKNLCDTWLEQLNAQRKRKRQAALTRLPMSAWLPLKAHWFDFMNLFLTSRLNVIFCARVAFDYDIGESDDGSQEIQKTGVKISAEKDTGYESSLLVEMERVEKREGGRHSAKRIDHRATVLGDRFGVIDGHTCEPGHAAYDVENGGPTFEFFRPHVALLRPEAHSPVDTTRAPDAKVDDEGNDEWRRERRERDVLREEIKHELLLRWPSQKAPDKRAKGIAISDCFGTPSWKAVERMNSERLRFGLTELRKIKVPTDG